MRDLGAVVVGGGSGIGRGIALALGAEGARVFIADIDVGQAEAVRDEIIGRGGQASAGQVDATSREQLALLADQAAEELGRVNLLIHMVGVISDAEVTNSS